MRTALLTMLALLCCLSPAAELPATHREVSLRLIELLTDTSACLESCTDAATVQAALPRLKELAAQAAELKATQDKLPEPTTQDYMIDKELLGAFNTAWKTVRDHIDRLEKAQLVSPELREVLRITPPGA